MIESFNKFINEQNIESQSIDENTVINNKLFYYDLPPGDYDVEDYVLFISLYQDGFRAEAKSPNQSICYKINGINFSDYSNSHFFPPFCNVKKEHLSAVFSTIVKFEVLLGRHGFYVKTGDISFAHIQYSIESIDGDVPAQFFMSGRPGGASSGCPCIFGCYMKNFSPYLMSFLPLLSELGINPTNIKLSVISLSNDSSNLLSYFSSLSMMLRYSDNSIEKLISKYSTKITENQKKELMCMESIAKAMNFSKLFSWMLPFESDLFNCLSLKDFLYRCLIRLSEKNKKILEKGLKARNTNMYLIKDYLSSFLNDNNCLDKIIHSFISYDALAEPAKPINNLDQLSILSIPEYQRFCLDLMHLLANFLDWIIDLLFGFSMKNETYDQFFIDILSMYFDDISELEQIKRDLSFPDCIIENAVKRIKEIRKLNQGCPSWLNENIFSKADNNTSTKVNLKSDSIEYYSMKSHDKILLLLSLFEVIFIDSISHPILFSLCIIIRCISYLYNFNNGVISDLLICKNRLNFYLNVLLSYLPPSINMNSIHRLSHLGECVELFGVLKIHENLKMEKQFSSMRLMTRNSNNKQRVTVNNRLITAYMSSFARKVINRNKPPRLYYFIDYKNVLQLKDDRPFYYDLFKNGNRFKSLLNEKIILHSYLDDMCFQKCDCLSFTTVCDIVLSNGIDMSTIDASLQRALDELNMNSNNLSVEITNGIYTQMRYYDMHVKSEVTLKAMKECILQEGRFYLPSLLSNERVLDGNLNEGFAVMIDKKQHVVVCVVLGFVKTVVKGCLYPLALCCPLNDVSTSSQSSQHVVTVSSVFNMSNLLLLSLNRLYFDNYIISRSIYQDTFNVSILKITIGQYHQSFNNILTSISRCEVDRKILNEKTKIKILKQRIQRLNKCIRKSEEKIKHLEKQYVDN